MDAPLLIVGASMAGLRTAEGARRAGYASTGNHAVPGVRGFVTVPWLE